MAIVEIKNLTKRFDKLTAVNNVSLEIRQKEIFGLLGPNGAGKSTLINILTGLLKADSGTVTIFGETAKGQMNDIKRRMGVIPQDLAIYDDLTARDNIKFFASLYGLKGKKLKNAVDKALEFTGLTESAKKMPKKFSGGMKRRLNIACGIAHQPELIIMDEPTVGIDPQSRNHIIESVKNLSKQGKTIIYTTHYMEEAEALCSRIGIIDHGKIIAKGSQTELKSLIQDKKRFLVWYDTKEAINTDDINKIPGVLNTELKTDHINIECSEEEMNIGSIVEYFNKKNIKIKNINSDDPDLELVFLSLTGRNLRD